MDKQGKVIAKALASLGLSYDGNDEINTMSDVKRIIAEREQLLIEAEGNLIELQEAIVQVKDEIATLKTLEHQIKVEEYKELNPKHRVF